MPRENKFTVDPDVPVHCACDDYIPLDEFKEFPNNPNKHPPLQIQLLGDIIGGYTDNEGKEHPGTGWRSPITVSKRSGYITKGHGRLAAARYKNFRGAPVDYQDYESYEQEVADVIADNKIAELSRLNKERTTTFLEQIKTANPMMLKLTGFSPVDLKRHFEPVVKEKPQYELAAELNEKYDYVLVFCDNEVDYSALKTMLGITNEVSYKKENVGLGRVITFKRFMEQLHLHSDMIEAAK